MRKSKRFTPISKELQKTLDKTGITRLRAEGRRPQPIPFPDLKVDNTGVSPTSDRILYVATPAKHCTKTKHTVSHFHKQGYQVVSKSDLAYIGGKKP